MINLIEKAHAQSYTNPLKADNLLELLSDALQVLIQYGVAVAAIAIVYSGFIFVTARGNPEKIKTAKQVLWWTIIGATVVLGAWVIVTVISNTVTELSA